MLQDNERYQELKDQVMEWLPAAIKAQPEEGDTSIVPSLIKRAADEIEWFDPTRHTMMVQELITDLSHEVSRTLQSLPQKTGDNS